MSQPRSASYNWVYGMLLVLSVLVLIAGGVVAVQKSNFSLLAAGCGSLVAVLALWPISCQLAAHDDAIKASIAPVNERLGQAASTLYLMSEQQLISDRAKQVAFREKDRDAFRRAIQEDIAKGEYDIALALVDNMDREFGYQAEAARLREVVISRREEQVGRQVDEAARLVDRMVESEQWPAALKEAERIRGLYPTQVRAQTMVSDVEDRRTAKKRELLTRWHESVRLKQVDDSISILRKLDAYLTPVEAAGLEEDARMMFREKMTQLRESFTAAVQQHNWADARRHGERIMADFPNTQMAREVKEMWTTLEERSKSETAPAVA